ncbi:MAG: DUF378 domain-containing protein [Desulfobacterales bacterium]
MERRSNIPKGIDIIAAVILVIGGLNWGLIGFFGFNLVDSLFGVMSPMSRVVYALVGLSAVYEIVMWRAIQRRWECKTWPESAEKAAA